MKIHDVYAFDAKQAAQELLDIGFTVVDDISGELIQCAQDELFDALGFGGDELDLGIEEVPTTWGPVFVFWNRRARVFKKAIQFVSDHRTIMGSAT